MSELLKIGVVGYSGQRFDETQACDFLRKALDKVAADYPHHELAIVSGLTDLGIPHLAYLEAVRRGMRTVGIASEKAQKYQRFPVEEKMIVGKNWGDESHAFLQNIDLLIRIGGGKQTMNETAAAKQRGTPVIEYDLPAEP